MTKSEIIARIGKPKCDTTSIFERKHVIHMTGDQVRYALASVACECVENYVPNIDAPGVTYKVAFGATSPNTTAIIEIIEDLAAQDAAMAKELNQ